MKLSQKTGKVLTTLLATRPMWGMFPLRTIFGVMLILEGMSRFAIAKHNPEAIIGQIPGEWALVLVVIFSVIEIGSGLLSLIGFAQRLVGLLIVTEMSFVIFVERVPIDVSRDLQTQILLFAIASMVLFSGAGRFSIDRYLARQLLKTFPNKKKELYCIAETPYTKWWE